MNKETKTVYNNTIMLYILQISKYIFPLLTFPYLTRVLQPENYGNITFANAVMVYFYLFIDFGFLQSATRECSLFRNDKEKLAQIAASTVQAKMILGLIGTPIIFSLVLFSEAFNGRETYIVLAYVSVLVGIFNLDYLFRGLEIMKVITYRTIMGRTIYTIMIFLFIHKPQHYLLLPVISAFGEIIIIVWTWLYIKRSIGLKIKIVSLVQTLSAFKTSAIFFLSRIASTAYSATNIVILGLIYDNWLLAQFGVADALIVNLRSLFGPIADSLYPYMVLNRNYKLVKKILLILMPVIVTGTVGLFFLAEPIISIVAGRNYVGATPIFRAFLPIVIITLPVYLLGFPVLGAMDRMKDANLSVIFAAFYHTIGLGILYYSGNCTFISVALLTCSTELVVLLFRAICVQKGMYDSQELSHQMVENKLNKQSV